MRYFILYLLSQQILDIGDLIEDKKNAIFVSSTSTVLELRWKYSNLYFVSAANNYLHPLINKISITNTCLVYSDESDAFVKEVIRIFSIINIPTFSITDHNIGDLIAEFYTISMVSSSVDIFRSIVEILENRQEKHYLFSIEISPPEDLKLPENVVDVIV